MDDREIAGVLRDFGSVRREDWREWHALSVDAPPFLSPEFFALSQPLTDGEPVVVEAWDSHGVLVGVLPLARVGRTLSAMHSDHSPAFDYVGDPDALDAVMRALDDDRRWDTLVFKDVAPGSVVATRLRATFERDGARVVVRPGARHRVFDLPGFEARLTPKFLANLRRCARKVGGIELEKIASPTRSDFEAALAIEAAAWKGHAHSGMASDARVAHLYEALTRHLGRHHRAAIAFLRARGERIAMLLSVEDARAIYALKIGYDPRFAAASPGHLMVWAAAKDAESRGLARFDFVGRDDEWKHKWTEQIVEHVSLVVYRRSARGLALYAAHEKLAPRVREHVGDLHAPLRHGCQRDDVVGAHTLVMRARGRVRQGLGVRSGVRRWLAGPDRGARLGEPSRFAEGSWVRVIDADRLRATLDAKNRLRGLEMVPTQWETCGRVLRVSKVVRRMRDDHGRMRPIARTVLLDGVTCAGSGPEPAGCGRHCPLLFRDAWLEPAEAPTRAPPAAWIGKHAHVRDLSEIRATLDVFGRRHGVTFMPEMAEHAGHRFRIAGVLERVFEYDRWVPTRGKVYVLEGTQCKGSSCGERGPCDRACALLWHEDWLVVDDAAAADAEAHG